MDTSVSFLDSLRQAEDDGAWSKLVDLYSPLIRGWLTRRGAAKNDVDDITQDVLAVVVRRFPEFRRGEHQGSFRAWLRTIAVNCLRDHWKKNNKRPQAVGGTDFGEIVEQFEDPNSSLSKMWDREHDEHVTQYLLKEIRSEFKELTWKAFERFAIDGLSADEVAKELGTTPNAVFIAKSRVMSVLRDRGRGLIG